MIIIVLGAVCLQAPRARERAAYRYGIAGATACVASVPAGLAVTIGLFPFWDWLERTTGLESVGHSGPAEWCYLVVYSISVAVLGCAGLFLARRRAGQGVE